MANPFQSQVDSVRSSGLYDDKDAWAKDTLRSYLGGDNRFKDWVRGIAGAGRPDTARSALANLEARDTQRRGLIQGIESMPGQFQEETDLLKGEANRALESGLSNTRKNFNKRGLLYSGLREGGEQSVKGGVASSLASGMAGATRDYQNLLDQRKQALASLGLQTQAQQLEAANQAFEMTQRNNVARAQAFQQLGQGVGYGAGMWAGGAFSREPSTPSTGGYSSGMNSYGNQPRIRPLD
jgi:hypothetical protein